MYIDGGTEPFSVFQITFKVRESVRNFRGAIGVVLSKSSFSFSGQEAGFVSFLA